MLPQKGKYYKMKTVGRDGGAGGDGGQGGSNQNPFIMGNIFWNNAISGLSPWCQVIRGLMLLGMEGIQTK